MLTVRLARMGRNVKYARNGCLWGHDWVYIKAGADKNYGIRICKTKGCGKKKHIRDFAAAINARERRIK